MRSDQVLAIFSIAATLLAVGVSSLPASDATVGYAASQVTHSVGDASLDPISRLQARLNSGELKFEHDSITGYLRSVLGALNIPISSQGLVFSRTSLQTDLIAPWSPRAVYFGDDIYIGFVQGSDFLEIATVSPTSNARYYTLPQDPEKRPVFEQDDTCLSCHQSPSTGNVPGFLMLSSVTDKSGYFLTGVRQGSTTDATPVKLRFGGWYVTGSAGASAGHSGNVAAPKGYREISDKEAYKQTLDLTIDSERKNLSEKFDTSRYLSGSSDIVALMVLTHQTAVHNLISALHTAAAAVSNGNDRSYRGTDDERSASFDGITDLRFNGAVERLVKGMLFIGEAPIHGPMRGTTSFSSDFSKIGPRDGTGRSLRDFDLQRRLFKYPLSFLIYSEAFDALPLVARDAVYIRLRKILKGEDPRPEFVSLALDDRKAILEILTATKPEFNRE